MPSFPKEMVLDLKNQLVAINKIKAKGQDEEEIEEIERYKESLIEIAQTLISVIQSYNKAQQLIMPQKTKQKSDNEKVETYNFVGLVNFLASNTTIQNIRVALQGEDEYADFKPILNSLQPIMDTVSNRFNHKSESDKEDKPMLKTLGDDAFQKQPTPPRSQSSPPSGLSLLFQARKTPPSTSEEPGSTPTSSEPTTPRKMS